MIIMRGRQSATAMQQMRGGQMRSCAGGFQCFNFQRIAVGFVE